MPEKGPAKKVTVFVNETTRYHGQPLHDAILRFLLHKGVSGATATRGVAGFGSRQTLATQEIEVLAMNLPVRIEFIDSAAKVDEVMPTLRAMVHDGLIEVQDTVVVAHGPRQPEQAPKRPQHRRVEGPAKLLRVYLGEADRWDGEPLYDAIVKKLRHLEIAGATVYRGILGYGAKGHEHKRSFFHPMRDLPVMVSVVDLPERIALAVAAIEEMLEDGLIVLSDVEMVRIVRGEAAGTESGQ